ncbi:uncharacterized protein LOC110041867 [Orbicella faveolata]|uniref:uncharacterized protein LOC110041867 n=1 Tax=Orbicella faveolata TaxID=48498 RepID=UPI0009E26E75|nr:uncharacterized protein LOC110041867 [Orbicella faveolata]
MEGTRDFDDAPTSNTQATNWQDVSQIRSMMSNMYPTTQQPGSTSITQPNLRAALNQDMPPNHILLAILSTLFCACPCGVMSLCYAVQVKDDFLRGNTAGAHYNSRQAWRWGIVSVAVGCLAITVALIYYMVLLSLRL